MSKKFFIIASVVLLLGCLGVLLFHEYLDPRHDNRGAFTEKEIAEASRKAFGEPVSKAQPSTGIKPGQTVRLAIGSLGFPDEEQDHRLGDLMLAELSNVKGLDLVERQALEKVLSELQLNLSSLAHGQEAVRVGKLIQADWFLLGTAVELNGTNYLVTRMVDVRTGVLRETGVFAKAISLQNLGGELAGFVQQCRQNATQAKAGVYLSLGSFEDFSLNNRRSDLPRQLRSYLTAAYQTGNVTLLERDFANALLKEIQLELAGLTEESGTNMPVMQSAYWMLNGYYQSYEDSGIELVLSIRRLFGRNRQVTLREQSVEALFRRVKQSIDEEMERNQAAVVLSRLTELRTQLTNGKEIFRAGNDAFAGIDLVWLSTDYNGIGFTENEIARRRRNIEEAIRAFEAVLLLDTKHREAKMYLAACYRQFYIGRTEEALGLYRQVIEEGINDSWTSMAGKALGETFRRASVQEKLRWFEEANRSHPHEIYQGQIKVLGNQMELGKTGTAGSEQLAEQRLFEDVDKWERDARRGGWALNFGNLGFRSFVEAFGTNQAQAAERLVALLPKLQATASNLSPYLVAGTLIYQVKTNTPLLAQFEESLEEAASHPEKLFGAEHYFLMISREVHDWSMAHGLYFLAARTQIVRERMAQRKLAKPLDNNNRIGLAFTYLRAEAWREALEIFQSYSNRPVMRGFVGATNEAFMPVFTGKYANHCRKKLGLPVQQDSREFKMGTNCLCLHNGSAVLADREGLWVATGEQLLRLDFDLKTNLVVTLPNGGAPVTVLTPGDSKLWIGTAGDGLIEFDKPKHSWRHLTVKNGLMMNSISSLHIAGNLLWIGYGSTEGGGLGRMELDTGSLKSYTLSLADGTDVQRHPTGNMAFEDNDKPPHRIIQGLASGPGKEICFSTEMHPLRRYRPKNNTWSACPLGSGNCVVGDTKRIFVGSQGEARALGVTVWEFEGDKVWGFKESAGLPFEQVTTLTLDGQDLWVGGFGFVGVADANEGNVRKFAYVPARRVEQIQVGGGYVWAVYDRHLHRAPLRDVQ